MSSKKINQILIIMLPLLEHLTDTEKRATIDEARQWITSINRGGPTKITDTAF